jgi:hypothetical protein
MNKQQPIERPQHTIFELIREGMDVEDAAGKHIGEVRRVYFGADAGSTEPYSGGAATAPDPSLRRDTLIDNVAEAIFGDDDLPETFRNRLINNGFIQLDADGLFASDRYVMREQIANVTGDTVHLNVTRDELLKR